MKPIRQFSPGAFVTLGAFLLLAILAAGALAESPHVPATVRRVVDGDTIIAAIPTPGGGLQPTERVRLVGIDCPESSQIPWGPQATARLRQLVAGNPIGLEVAFQSRDRYGRLLASVWVGKDFAQEVLVREGLCMIYTVPPNVEHADRLQKAQQEARQAGRGIWSPTEGLPESPSQYRRRSR